MGDSVNHPPHYTQGGIEVIDAIEAWELGFHLGNVVKYIVRSPHKGAPIQDLKKARWYLDRAISKAESIAAQSSTPGPYVLAYRFDGGGPTPPVMICRFDLPEHIPSGYMEARRESVAPWLKANPNDALRLARGEAITCSYVEAYDLLR